MRIAVALAVALSACGPHISTPMPHDGGPDTPSVMVDTPPAKPPLPPTPLPPNVTREVLPDGSIRITIREPICTTCQPWTY